MSGFPWTIAPNQMEEFVIRYTPSGRHVSNAGLQILSDDPLRPDAQIVVHVRFRAAFNWCRAALSPGDAGHAACGSGDGAVLVWSTATGACEAELKTHTGAVAACAWGETNGGRQMATCDKNGFLVVWEPK